MMNHLTCSFHKVKTMATECDVDDPQLPRQRKRPRRYDDGASADFPITVEDMYRRVYFEVLDLITETIKNRFDQPGYKMYRHLEELLMKASKKENFSTELQYVSNFYGDDIHKDNLEIQLNTLDNRIKDSVVSIFDVRDYLKNLTTTERTLLNEVVIVAKLLLVMPATNASSERSFSAMSRVKSYLRSTMGQERLNNFMMLHVHKEATDMCM